MGSRRRSCSCSRALTNYLGVRLGARCARGEGRRQRARAHPTIVRRRQLFSRRAVPREVWRCRRLGVGGMFAEHAESPIARAAAPLAWAQGSVTGFRPQTPITETNEGNDEATTTTQRLFLPPPLLQYSLPKFYQEVRARSMHRIVRSYRPSPIRIGRCNQPF